MATYRTAPNLGKPPAPETLSKRHRHMSKQGAAALREASAGRKYGTKADLERQAREEARRTALHPGPHPLPVERLSVEELTGSAKSLAKWIGEHDDLAAFAATNGREVEVRIAEAHLNDGQRLTYARAVFRDGRLVHAFALVGGQYVKVTLTALKAELAKAAP